MLRVTVELIPFGNESKKKMLDQFTIYNDGSHDKRPEYGNYVCNHYGGSFCIDDHKRDDGFWPLVHRALHGYINLEEVKE